MNKKFLFAGMIVFALIATLFTPSTALFDKLSTDRPPISSSLQDVPLSLKDAVEPISNLPDAEFSIGSNIAELGDRTPIYKCGDISTDTTWVADTYVLTCTVNVLSGSTLSIEPGAVIKAFTNDIYGPVFGLQVAGTLSALGTADQPIVFTSLLDDSFGGDTNNDETATSPAAGQWTRIGIVATGTATLDHVTIRYAGGYLWTQSRESIRNAGGTLNLQNSTIEFGGGSAIRSDTNGVIDIQDNLIQNNTEYGLYYSASGPVTPIIKNNTFTSNTSYAIYFNLPDTLTLDGTQMNANTALTNGTNGLRLSGTLAGTSTLSGNLGFPYVLEGTTFVSTGSSLTIEPGAVFKSFTEDIYAPVYGLQISGSLSALGTSDLPIVFTSLRDDTFGGDTNNNADGNAPAAGHWTRIAIDATGTATLDHVTIRYAGGYLWTQSRESIRNAGGTLNLQNSTIEFGGGSAIRSDTNGVIDIQDNLIQNNTEYGLYYSASGPVTPIIKNNTFTSNTSYAIYFNLPDTLTLDGTQMNANTALTNGTNGLRLSGTLAGTSTLSGNLGFPYVLEGTTFVSTGSSLTIEPGAVFKSFTEDIYAPVYGLQISGSLSALGTSDLPIVFTSLRDDTFGGDTNNNADGNAPAAGHWTRIAIDATGTATLDHVTIRYAGGYLWTQSRESIRNAGGTLNLQNSTIEFGGGSAIRSDTNGVIDIQNNLIQNNGEYGLGYSANGAVAPVIKNNSFTSNASYAVYFIPSGDLTLDGTQMSGNTAINNGTNGLRLAGTLAGTSILSGDLGFPYVFEGTTFVSTGSSLTIEPGAVFKAFTENSNGGVFGLQVAGSLSAIGTDLQPIVFTSLRDDTIGGDTNNNADGDAPAAGHWTRIAVDATGSTTLDHVRIRYAGGYLWLQSQESIRNAGGTLSFQNSTIEFGAGSGIRSDTDGVIDIQDSLIQNNSEHGLYYSSIGTVSPIIKNNTFTANTSYAIYFNLPGTLTLDGTQMSGNTAINNGTNGLRLAGTLEGTSILSGDLGFPYVFDGTTTVSAGSTLTIEPGAVFKAFTENSNGGVFGLQVVGSLSAIGTDLQPIVFTSLRDDTIGGDTNNNADGDAPAAGHWTRIAVDATGSATLDHVSIRYAGGYLWLQSQESLLNNGALTLLYTTIEHSGGVGLRMNAGTLSVHSSKFFHNSSGIWLGTSLSAVSIIDSDFLGNTAGIYYAGNFQPVISNCIFEGNTLWGVINSMGFDITAMHNWWGSRSGPTHASNPPGTGDPVSDRVIFLPWLAARPRCLGNCSIFLPMISNP